MYVCICFTFLIVETVLVCLALYFIFRWENTSFFLSLQGVKTVERAVLEIKKDEKAETYNLLVEGLVHPLYFVIYF